MYKQSITMLLLIVASAVTCAADKMDTEPAQKEPVVTAPATAKQGKSAQPSSPLDSFTPSDRISADSTVSFPVDI